MNVFIVRKLNLWIFINVLQIHARLTVRLKLYYYCDLIFISIIKQVQLEKEELEMSLLNTSKLLDLDSLRFTSDTYQEVSSAGPTIIF